MMFFKDDVELVESFHVKSGHGVNSVKSYNTVFNIYRRFHGMSLCELWMRPYWSRKVMFPKTS